MNNHIRLLGFKTIHQLWCIEDVNFMQTEIFRCLAPHQIQSLQLGVVGLTKIIEPSDRAPLIEQKFAEI